MLEAAPRRPSRTITSASSSRQSKAVSTVATGGQRSSADSERATRARARQHARFQRSKLACNADMGPAEVRVHCELDETGRSLLRSAAQQMQLSARTYHRLLKVGRTIADLAGSPRIQTAHLAEAIQYRQRKT
jgi:magnesium chelatase family protein